MRAIPTFERKDLTPTYVCYLPRDRFDTEQKARIAGAITQRHSEATGAPSYFVQAMTQINALPLLFLRRKSLDPETYS